MHFIFKLLAFNLLIMISSCEQKHNKSTTNNLYFDIVQILDFQRKQYLNKPLSAYKITKDTQKVVISDWQKELGLFYSFNINIPKSRGTYKVGSIVRPHEVKHLYLLKKGEKAEVRQVIVTFDHTEKLLSIQATSQVDKWLYHSAKQIVLEFERSDSHAIGPLKKYRVKGKQGFIFFDESEFAITTVLL